RSHQPVGRGNIDNAPPTLLLHIGQGRRGAVENGRQIQRNNGIPTLDRKIFDQVGVLHARVVDEDVDTTPQNACRFVNKGAGGFGLAKVGVYIVRLYRELQLDIDPLFFNGLGITKTVDHYIGPIGSQFTGNAQANSTG